MARLAFIERFGFEAYYGREGAIVMPDGGIARVYYDGMPGRDVYVSQVMRSAEASVASQRSTQQRGPGKGKRTVSQRY